LLLTELFPNEYGAVLRDNVTNTIGALIFLDAGLVMRR
jgi:hypothetical protein